MKHCDVTIIGTGMIGLSLAALLSKRHFSVALIESETHVLSWPRESLTTRVSAIHRASHRLFEYLNIWEKIDPAAYAPLKTMQIWDCAGTQIDFDSADVHVAQMGWIVENRAIVKALCESLQHDSTVDFYCPNKPAHFILENNLAKLTLHDQTTLSCDLVVGSDGAHSWLRQRMPVTLEERPYYHKAITAVIESSKPHHHCAYQKFSDTGPIALLPTSRSHQTALVWSADHDVSDNLLQESDDAFSHTLTKALDGRLGICTVKSSRHQFPLIRRHANDYVSAHCALIGDAAHTIHPLAGLGANLGLMDAACLAETITNARDRKKPIGSLRTLRRYARWRKADNAVTMATMDVLKNIFCTNESVVNMARNIGVNLLNNCPIAKKQIMRKAMGESSDLPIFLQSLKS